MPSQERRRDYMDSDEEIDLESEAEEEAEEYRVVSDVTAQMFQPTWMSVCRFLENSHMFRLRYSGERSTMLALCRHGLSE